MHNFTESLKKLDLKPARLESISRILLSALGAADPFDVVKKNIVFNDNNLHIGDKTFPLYPDSQILLVSIGKAAYAMAKAAQSQLGQRISDGVIVCKHHPGDAVSTSPLRLLLGSHPVPDQNSVEAAEEIRHLLEKSKQNDVVVFLVSGGGSSLVCLPAPGITLQDMQKATSLLLASGASINEMNSVRKHLDLFKGGGFLKLAAPARVGALVISDVVNSPLDVIASGPAVPDPSTFFDAKTILDKFIEKSDLPESIRLRVESGCQGQVEETLKPFDEISATASHTVIASNLISAKSALKQAIQEGFQAELINCELTGEAQQAGIFMTRQLKKVSPLGRPFVGIAGGETTVRVRGSGLGGRNLEVALSAVAELDGLHNSLLITLATDGEDGPTDAAGAYVTGETFRQAVSMGLDPAEYLRNNDAYHFFEKVGSLIKTGPTGTNVNDLNFIFRLPE